MISQVFQHHRQRNNIALRKLIAAWQRDGERNSIASITTQHDGSAPAAIASIAANMRSYAAESPLLPVFPQVRHFVHKHVFQESGIHKTKLQVESDAAGFRRA